jgi:hypothetical protein
MLAIFEDVKEAMETEVGDMWLIRLPIQQTVQMKI